MRTTDATAREATKDRTFMIFPFRSHLRRALDGFPPRDSFRVADGKPPHYVLNLPMPKSVLLGPLQHGKESKYEVVPSPDIQIPLVDRRKN
jgi:hypothetical protein